MAGFGSHSLGSLLTLVPYESGHKITDFTHVSLVSSVTLILYQVRENTECCPRQTPTCVVRESAQVE